MLGKPGQDFRGSVSHLAEQAGQESAGACLVVDLELGGVYVGV